VRMWAIKGCRGEGRGSLVSVFQFLCLFASEDGRDGEGSDGNSVNIPCARSSGPHEALPYLEEMRTGGPRTQGG
jgi:hypothetical protein